MLLKIITDLDKAKLREDALRKGKQITLKLKHFTDFDLFAYHLFGQQFVVNRADVVKKFEVFVSFHSLM